MRLKYVIFVHAFSSCHLWLSLVFQVTNFPRCNFFPNELKKFVLYYIIVSLSIVGQDNFSAQIVS